MWFSSADVVRLTVLSFVFGLGSGAFYDLFRIWRIARRPSRRRAGRIDFMLCVVEDLLYWLILSAAYCVFIFDAAGGRLRLISLAAAACGHLAWHFTLGRAVVFISGRIIAAVRAALRLLFRVTVVPALRALAFLLRPAVRACGYIYDKTKRARGLRSARRGYGLKIPKKGK